MVLLRAEVRSRFSPAGVYLNTPTVGLPSAATVAAMRTDLDRWATGTLDAAAYDEIVDRCRRLWAQLVGAPPGWVAVGHQVSPLVGLVAASLPADAEVLVAEEDFTSVLFPFLAQQQRGITVRTAPLEGLADRITASTTWVACSVVQSADGRLTDLVAIRRAADAVGARVLLDGTQSVGWLAVDPATWDVLVCGGYKWLCSPRGTAWVALRPEVAADLVPHAAGWYAGADIWSSIYGPPLRLADDGRRFDTSPAWVCWVGTLPALELLVELGVDAIGAHDVALANRLRAGLGMEPGSSAVVMLDAPGVEERLATAGVAASVRAGRLRVGFHLYNDHSDVDAVLDVLAGGSFGGKLVP
jgi:selenocysteine lyase/cysteine desulfurase